MTINEPAEAVQRRTEASGRSGTDPADPGPGGRPAAAPAGGPPMIATLTGLRTAAACWVVLVHFEKPLHQLFPWTEALRPAIRAGYLSVEIFFMLSGFILAANYHGRVSTGAGFGKFLWARFARIYPVFLTTLLAMVAFSFVLPRAFHDTVGNGFPETVGNFVANLFMLQAVPGFRGFDSPSWSLSCEMLGYLTFPLLVLWATGLRARGALVWAAVVAAGGIAAIVAVAPDIPQWHGAYPSMWVRVATDFTMGVLLWAWWRTARRDSPWWDLSAVLCVVAVLALAYRISPDTGLSFVALPFVALFVISCASASGPLGRLLCSRPMQWGGAITYSLYLGHTLVYLLLRRILPWEQFIGDHVAIRLAWFGVLVIWILAVAAGLYYLIEEPARKRLVAWWARRHRVRVSVPAAGSTS